MIFALLILIVSFLITFIFSTFIIPRLKRFRVVGKDINKPNHPEVAEMGGISIVVGFTSGVLLAVFFNTFFGFDFNLVFVLAALVTIHSISFIGIVDDILDIPQWLKAILPLFAAVPLVAVKAFGSTILSFPFFGPIDFGIFYIICLIPLGVAVASNLTNMLAGFNGMEAGMGSVIFIFASIIALGSSSPTEPLILYLAILGSLLGFLIFNWYPSRVFPGDIGNLTIGAVLVSGAIIGNFESAIVLLLSLYILDFFIKLVRKFPTTNWWGEYRNGKLYCPSKTFNGLAQFVMKITNGISELNLTLLFISLEVVIGLLTVLYFYFI